MEDDAFEMDILDLTLTLRWYWTLSIRYKQSDEGISTAFKVPRLLGLALDLLLALIHGIRASGRYRECTVGASKGFVQNEATAGYNQL